MRFPVSLTDTAVLSRSRPPFFCFDDPCTVFWHGGFRREPLCNENYFDKIRQGLACQKSCPPAAGTSGCAYVLYHVGKEHIAFCFALWVFDLPGEFCCFLRPAIRRKKKFQKSEKRRHLAGSQRDSIRSIGGKGENHHIPHRKGVRRWKRSPANRVNGASLTAIASWFCTMRR